MNPSNHPMQPEERYLLKSARFIAQNALEQFVQPGFRVVDATMGNGHDTLTLCRLVGDTGKVYAFDIQPQALENTSKLLHENHVAQRAELFCISHDRMAEHVPASVDAVVFNLGWLPGGNKQITTLLQTTKVAIAAALKLLRPLGLCIICVYPGHAEGSAERAYLSDMLQSLPPRSFNVLHSSFPNAGPDAPECYQIQKQPTCEA